MKDTSIQNTWIKHGIMSNDLGKLFLTLPITCHRRYGSREIRLRYSQEELAITTLHDHHFECPAYYYLSSTWQMLGTLQVFHFTVNMRILFSGIQVVSHSNTMLFWSIFILQHYFEHRQAVVVIYYCSTGDFMIIILLVETAHPRR